MQLLTFSPSDFSKIVKPFCCWFLSQFHFSPTSSTWTNLFMLFCKIKEWERFWSEVRFPISKWQGRESYRDVVLGGRREQTFLPRHTQKSLLCSGPSITEWCQGAPVVAPLYGSPAWVAQVCQHPGTPRESKTKELKRNVSRSFDNSLGVNITVAINVSIKLTYLSLLALSLANGKCQTLQVMRGKEKCKSNGN